MQANPAFTIRPYRTEDAEGVYAVQLATYNEKATPKDIYEWWSLGCSTATSGFMVAEAEGKIVGVQPMEIFPYSCGANSLRGAMLTGVAVHPDWRRLGIFSALVKACEAYAWEQGALFVTTMPNERSKPGFMKMGYADLGRRTLLVRPLRAVAMGQAIVPVLGCAAGGLASLTLNLLKPEPAASPSQLTFRQLNAFGPAHEQLYQQHQCRFPGVRMTRSAVWSTWRYLQHPRRQYHLLEGVNMQGTPEAFVALTIDKRGRFPIAYLLDLAVSDPRHLPAVLQHTIQIAKANAYALGAVISAPTLIAALRKHGFWEVPAWVPIKRFYSVAKFRPGATANPAWQSIADWYQTLSDWDNL